MNSVYFAMSAWREALARIFEGYAEQDNVSPEWLVNPATKRRLKLDKYFPDAGVAVRFVGLTAKGQGRQTDWEVLEEKQRDETRVELCRLHGVQLATIDPADEIVKQMDGLLSILARASRTLGQAEKPARQKSQEMTRLAAARDRAEKVRSALARNPEQMVANLAEAWRDRESGVALELNAPAPAPAGPARLLVLALGQRVHHVRFGAGVITRIEGSGPSAQVTILFDAAAERTFQADLLGDKVEIGAV